MTTQNNASQAVQQDPLSDEYVNAVIQRHGYDSPETVIASLAQWIGRHGGENSVTLLMYEAHKALSALSKLRAPVAGAEAARTAAEWATPENVIAFPRTACAHIKGLASLISSAASPLASAPVADERALHIKALQDLRLGVEMDQHYMDDGDAKLAALDAAITALRWSAGALQALNIEADKITLDGETRTVGDILDHADRALASTPVADERAAFEQAMRETYRMVDPLKPPPAGSYARGEHEGIIAALKTVRENFTRAALASASVAGEAQSVVAKLAEELGDLASDMAYEANQEMDQDKASRAAVIERGERALRGFVDAAPQASAEDVRNAVLEEAAQVLDRLHDENRQYHTEFRRAANAIRALKSTPAPTAAEGSEDDMLTIAYLAGAQAEKERAGDALLAELLDDPLLRDLLGYIEDTGPADVWRAAQTWMAKRNAALAARKEAL